MQIILYNNSSDRRYINKALTQIATLSAELTESCSIEAPEFIFDRNDNYISANYFYVPKFKRYYYMASAPEIINGNRMRISGAVDVRMSFKSQIYNAQIIADRSGSSGDPFIVDPACIVRDSIRVFNRKVANSPFTTGSYVLVIGGK